MDGVGVEQRITKIARRTAIGKRRNWRTKRRKALEVDHHLAAALERERAERAQWARARIELLSQFCAAGDGAPPVQGLLRAAEASPPPPVPPPPPPALE